MMRDCTPETTCQFCGAVKRMTIWEEGLSEVGDLYRMVRSESMPHTARDCERMQALNREQWPTLALEW